MIYKIIAVRDRAADVFAQPIFVPAVGVAIRSFGDEINRKEAGNLMAQHPEDFDLYLLGEYDDARAAFILEEVPRQVAVGKDQVREAV